MNKPQELASRGAELRGYAVQARDGPIGRVRELTLEDDSRRVRDVVVDTRPWSPGALLPVHPQYVERIDRRNRTLHLLLTRRQVKLSGAPSPRR